ncbi:M28 family metallopeptidase [Brevibacillus invocatus]|uniref:M28 family metallopeptidase n=1 Tax=Brevibacillus invocatus TaxID=173959 RepID=UPI00203CEC31|nr:M28 family metallopeptidase [Brevibacillus invocatus]MCM3080501.1 M20/M25/M40 family metallo-hydrolase [Brevibacillus invocatus]MCM3430736.1 M20/M25/M40 family metallo-hydrolase [Brevibacillus invocatus]
MVQFAKRNVDRIYQDILYLSSPDLSGRLSGTVWARKAAAFLAESLLQAGLSPSGEREYFSSVNVPAAQLVGPAHLKIGDHVLQHRIDFSEMSPYSSGGICKGPLVTVRDGDDLSPDQLAGKIVVIPELPPDFDLGSTIQSAADLGVAALLIESGEPNWFHKTVFGSIQSRIPVIRLRRSIAKAVVDHPGLKVHLELPLEINVLACQNVMGFLPGINQNRTLLLCAHYDHLGDDPDGLRFPGTIDNASGVAVILEVARLLAKREYALPFNVLVAFLTGEESGLWGSKQFASNPPMPLTAVVNLDCLGFETELHALRIGHQASGDWLTELASSVIKNHGVDVRWLAGGDDSVAFIQKGIPTIGLGQKPTLPESTSIHTVNDSPDNLHLKPIEKGYAIVCDLVNKLVDSPHFWDQENKNI